MILHDKKVVVTGGAGFLGAYVRKKLVERGVAEENIRVPRRPGFDLRQRESCDRAVGGADVVIHLAGVVGGIGFNKEHPAVLFYDNAAMALNMVEASYRAGIKKFVGIGTVCSYPKYCPTPFREGSLWDGYPEELNAPYGIAKKMMLEQTRSYYAEYGFSGIHLLMINLYGPGDNFDLDSSHVIPALIRKIREAREAGKAEVEVWGSGTATREFLYVEDAAEGIVLATEKYEKPDPVNLGSGMEISIKDLAENIAAHMNFRGKIRWNPTRPDGQPKRMLDVAKAEREFGFRARTGFEEGLRKTIEWYEAEIVSKKHGI